MSSIQLTGAQYRAHYLAADIAQCRFAMLVLIAPLLPFIYFDYELFGPSARFYQLVAARAGFLIYTLVLWHALPRVSDVARFDQHMLIWAYVGVGMLAFVNLTRPVDYFGHYVIDVWVILMFFSAVPLPTILQMGPAVAFVGFSLAILAFYKEPVVPMYSFSDALMLMLSLVGGASVSARIHRYRRNALMARLDVEQQANTDALTGIANRRAFMHAAALECERHRRGGEPLAVILIDLDGFKNVNDTHGHETGDAVLKECAHRITTVLRGYDLCARMGGEEFCIVLPGTTIATAEATAERIRQALSFAPIWHGDSHVSITASLGVAQQLRMDGGIEAAMARADEALYQAKREGRDRVVVHQPATAQAS